MSLSVWVLLQKMWYEDFEIQKEPDPIKSHEMIETLTQEYNRAIGEHFTPLQVRRRIYAIKYQPRKNEIRNKKALEQRMTVRNDQQQSKIQSTATNENHESSSVKIGMLN